MTFILSNALANPKIEVGLEGTKDLVIVFRLAVAEYTYIIHLIACAKLKIAGYYDYLNTNDVAGADCTVTITTVPLNDHILWALLTGVSISYLH